jgi:hypothetical protein
MSVHLYPYALVINLVGSEGFRRWCMRLKITGVPDPVHRPGLETRTRRFGNWIRFRPQVQELRLALSKGPNRVGVSLSSPENANRSLPKRRVPVSNPVRWTKPKTPAIMSTDLLFHFPAINNYLVRFEVFTSVTMKNSVFCDITPLGSRLGISSQRASVASCS